MPSGARAQWVMGLSLAAMLIGFYLFGYRPNSQKLDDLRLQIESKRRDVSSNKTKVKILPDVQSAVSDMRIRLEKWDKKLPRQPELGPFIGDITALGHDASLRRMFVEPRSRCATASSSRSGRSR